MKNQVKASNIIKKSHPKSTIELLIPDSMRYNDIVLRNINHNNERIILLQLANINDYIVAEYIPEKDWDEKLYSSQINNNVISKTYLESHITILEVNSPEYRKAFNTIYFTTINDLQAVILQATYCDNHAIVEYMEKDVYEYIIRKGKNNG